MVFVQHVCVSSMNLPISGNATVWFLEPTASTSVLAETLTEACFSSSVCPDRLVAVHQRRLTLYRT